MPEQITEETVTGCEYADRTVYTGSRHALVGAGLAADGPFPGDPPNHTSVRDHDASGRRRVLARAAGGLFRVTIYLTKAERMRRRRREHVNDRLARLSQQLSDVAESTPRFKERATRWVDLALTSFVHTFMAEDARGQSTSDWVGPVFDKSLHADLRRLHRGFVQALNAAAVRRDAEGMHAMERERAALADADFQSMLEELLVARAR